MRSIFGLEGISLDIVDTLPVIQRPIDSRTVPTDWQVTNVTLIFKSREAEK